MLEWNGWPGLFWGNSHPHNCTGFAHVIPTFTLYAILTCTSKLLVNKKWANTNAPYNDQAVPSCKRRAGSFCSLELSAWRYLAFILSYISQHHAWLHCLPRRWSSYRWRWAHYSWFSNLNTLFFKSPINTIFLTYWGLKKWISLSGTGIFSQGARRSNMAMCSA